MTINVMEKNRARKKYRMYLWEDASLKRAVGIGLTKKVIFKRRSEETEGANCKNI